MHDIRRAILMPGATVRIQAPAFLFVAISTRWAKCSTKEKEETASAFRRSCRNACRIFFRREPPRPSPRHRRKKEAVAKKAESIGFMRFIGADSCTPITRVTHNGDVQQAQIIGSARTEKSHLTSTVLLRASNKALRN